MGLASEAESQSTERKVGIDGVEGLAYQGRPGKVVAKNEGRGARESAKLAEELRELFGQHCKEARTERRLLQQEVAALSGIAQSDIARIEGGQKNVTLDTIMRIMRVVDREFARRVRSDLNERFGENVRASRTQMGLSQAKLAERAGVRTQYISRIEIGNANVTLEMVAKVALAMGQDPNQLLEGVVGGRLK
jgi:transcriptional regulator with XRE-family HTH domain